MEAIALAAHPEPANDSPPQTAPLRILLAEDNDTMRRLLAFVLRADGHDLVEARTGAELIEALGASLIGPSARAFDAVVSQQSLPGTSGLLVLAGMRARGLTTPFVLITASADAQRETERLGGVVLDQPFNVRAIRAAILSTMRTSQGGATDCRIPIDAR
jgi:two-component system, OmpR family, KDP operon response regulator KdpE